MTWNSIKSDLKYPLLVAVIILFVLTNKQRVFNWVFPPGKKYGVAFNAERERLGIATLPDTWITNDRTKERKVWYAPNRPDSGYFRYTKEVIVKSGNIFYDGDIYLHVNKTEFEKLTISYTFQGQNGREYRYFNRLNGAPERNITKFQSDSILKSWGLTYK